VTLSLFVEGTTVTPSPYPLQNVGDPQVTTPTLVRTEAPITSFLVPYELGSTEAPLMTPDSPVALTTGIGTRSACQPYQDSHDLDSGNQP
jgi:hypothetical protein